MVPALKPTTVLTRAAELDVRVTAAGDVVVEIEGASHAVGVSHPKEVADTILRALKDVE